MSNLTTAPTQTTDYRWCKFIDDTKLDKTQVLNVVYPIGSIYESTVNINPARFIGGTWASFGGGQFLLGHDGESFLAGNTGGASTVALTAAQMPSHRHGILMYAPDSPNTENTRRLNADVISAVGEHSSYYCDDAGGNQSHENMPPYIIVHRWRRTA